MIFVTYIFLNFLGLSLKCLECTTGDCLVSNTNFGAEKNCTGLNPVCVKQEGLFEQWKSSEGVINGTQTKRMCQVSYPAIPLVAMDDQCFEYEGKKTCYCASDKCNSAPNFLQASVLSIILIPAITLTMMRG